MHPMKFPGITVSCIAMSMLSGAVSAADESVAAARAVSGDPMAVGNLVQLTLGMLAVLLLLGGMAWLMRRSGRFTSGMHGALRILGGVSMGTRERIVLLQVGDQQLLVGVAPGRIQTLHVLDEPIAAEEQSAAEKPAFAQALDMALGRRKPQ